LFQYALYIVTKMRAGMILNALYDITNMRDCMCLNALNMILLK